MVSTPLKNISQLGSLFPIYGKIKKMFQTTNQISIEHHQTPCSSFSASHFDSHQKGQDPDDHERFEPRPSTCSRVFDGSLMIRCSYSCFMAIYCVLWRLMVVSMVFYGCLMAFDGSFCPKKWKCNQLQGGYETAATFHMFHDRSYSHSLHIPFKLKGIMFTRWCPRSIAFSW